MARRRSSGEVDSLELLLDTICNMFGGIIFITILVVILTSAQTTQVRKQSESAVADLNRQNRADELKSQIEDQQAALADIQKTREILSDNSSANLEQKTTRLQQSREEITRRAETARRWLKEYEAMASSQDVEVQSRLDNAQKRVAALEVEVNAVQSAHTVETRLPLERRTNRKQMLMLLRGNKAFWIPLGRASTLIDHRFGQDVQIDDMVTRIIIRPKAGGGSWCQGNLDQVPLFAEIIRRAEPQDYFFDLYVAGDSIEAFHAIKSWALHKGYRYNVSPLEPDRDLVFGPATSLNEQ
jgi:predicted Holliday junction resolvase-like endonuclease